VDVLIPSTLFVLRPALLPVLALVCSILSFGLGIIPLLLLANFCSYSSGSTKMIMSLLDRSLSLSFGR